jgi:hypothetical protein
VRRLGDDSGAVAIIVALLLVVFLVLGALVLDLGSLYRHDRELQSAADAGALAGAQELVLSRGNLSAAENLTRQYVSSNTSPNSSVVEGNLAAWAPVIDAKSVTVDLRENHVPFSLARVIGRSEGSVRAHAKAEVKYLTGVNTLFPVALLIMNPEKFRFVFRAGKTVVGSFDITDENENGVFGEGGGEGGGTLPSVSAGRYEVDLQAITRDINGNEVVGLELPSIGYWWVSNPSDPAEKLYRVGMSRSGGTVTVKAEVASTAVDPGLQTLQASLGGRSFQLSRSGNVFTGSVSAPTGTDNNTGYGVHELSITFPKYDTEKATTITCARYVAFEQDVPLDYLMMENSFYEGYSRRTDQGREFQYAEIVTDHPDMWDPYTMKLSAQAGGGLYSGNWRLSDIFANQNVRDEIAEVDPEVLDSWRLNTPLYIGGPLWPETGAKVGQVWQGLDDRKADWLARYPDDPDGWRYVIVPFVNFDPDLAGTSKKYVIQMFATFRIDSYSKKGQDKGDIIGQFIEWVAPGSWSDEPSGPLYVETVVLTE